MKGDPFSTQFVAFNEKGDVVNAEADRVNADSDCVNPKSNGVNVRIRGVRRSGGCASIARRWLTCG